jgi:predicted DNA-binding transcriptional regulator AlpA
MQTDAVKPAISITRVAMPDEGYVRLPTILAVFPVGRSTWWAGVKSGKYPHPVKLGPNTTAWRVEDIRALVQQAAK